MGYTGAPFGPMWFRIMFPGLVIGFVVLTFWVVLATHPGQTFPASTNLGFLLLGAVGMVFIGAGLLVGGRARFRWQGWQQDETQRNEAARQLADRAFAPLREKVLRVPPKTKTK